MRSRVAGFWVLALSAAVGLGCGDDGTSVATTPSADVIAPPSDGTSEPETPDVPGWPEQVCVSDVECLSLEGVTCYTTRCDTFTGFCAPVVAIEGCTPAEVEEAADAPDAAEDAVADDAEADVGPVGVPCSEESPCEDDADPRTVDSCSEATSTCTTEPAPNDCWIAECGTDACGNPCGECPYEAMFCDEGTCRFPCGDVELEGCCAGEDLRYCFQGKLIMAGCGNGCGWNPTSDYYECGYTGEDPSGQFPRECPPLPI